LSHDSIKIATFFLKTVALAQLNVVEICQREAQVECGQLWGGVVLLRAPHEN